MINTSMEDKGKSDVEEQLVNHSFDSCKSFQVEIISMENSLILCDLHIDNAKYEILLAPRHSDVKINIHFRDLIGFVTQESIDEAVMEKILKEVSSKNLEAELENKKFANLNFFPKIKRRSCTWCGWICCKCTKQVEERKPKNIQLLIPLKNFFQIKKEMQIISANCEIIEIDLNFRRKLLLFINPAGGRGTAMKVWTKVERIFNLSNLEIEVCRTTHHKHAYEKTLSLDINNYQGIITCSGDGILHEVINAIFHRPDNREFIDRIPIGAIPGGTGNGYSKVICMESKEECTAENCAYIIVKGCVKNFDIQEIETRSKNKIYSFLSLTWGIIADIDLESEKIRCCGSTRFTMYGAWRFLFLRRYFAALYYLPQENELENYPSIEEDLSENKAFVRENAQWNYFLAANVSHIAETIKVAPKAQVDDGFTDLLKIKASSGKCSLLKQLFNQDEGDYFDNSGNLRDNLGLEYVKTKLWRLIPKTRLDDTDDVTQEYHLPRFYSIDGERYPIEPIQVKVLKRALKVFCLNVSL